jgi:radical SAM superfamily enzyme YgiQ (UPF0313 family)
MLEQAYLVASLPLARLIDERLRAELGRIPKQAPFAVALAYPAPYAVAMSSLGFQRIYRAVQESDGMMCERAFLPDGAAGSAREVPVTYESRKRATEFPVLAFSIACEIEIAGIIRFLELAGIPALREQRDQRYPFVLVGGPLTFSNPLPLAPFADAIVVGEADTLAVDVLRVIAEARSRCDALAVVSRMRHIFVPEHHEGRLPPVARCDDVLLPAWAPIRTRNAELSGMFLIEAERGCSRGCAYCVMRGSKNRGMRAVAPERVLALVPEQARRVGLVGAAVSDHPKIVDIVRALADRGREVGLSSLRPDRLTGDFVAALEAGGYRTLTTAMDGPSERMRTKIERHAHAHHFERAADLARAHGMKLKLYLMLGLPGETDADVDECVLLVSDLSRRVPVSIGVSPFCAKRNTPFDGKPFAGMDVIKDRLDRLRRGLRGRATVRSTSAKWAWVEHMIAQGDAATGRAVLDAVHAGGDFAAFRKAFATADPTEAPSCYRHSE